MSRPPIGWHHTEETKKKISEGHKGKVVSEETRQKLSILNKGKKQSPETIAKRAEKQKGRKHPPRSEEWRRKQSEAGKKRWEEPEYRQRMSELPIGKKQSQETIEKRVAQFKGEKHWAWKGGDVTKKCEECGKEFPVEHYRKDEARFCSPSCHGKWMSKHAVGNNSSRWQGGGISKKCEECGKKFPSNEIKKVNGIKMCKKCSDSLRGDTSRDRQKDEKINQKKKE